MEEVTVYLTVVKHSNGSCVRLHASMLLSAVIASNNRGDGLWDFYFVSFLSVYSMTMPYYMCCVVLAAV